MIDRFMDWCDSLGGVWGGIVYILAVLSISAMLSIAFLFTLYSLGLIHDLNCPPHAREMRYSVGKITHTVCAIEVPERND